MMATILSLILLSALNVLSLTGDVRVTDSLGVLWSLDTNWQTTRPYPKDLRERERWYVEKNGEYWRGSAPYYIVGFGKEFMSPGIWTWEEFAIIPDGKRYWGTKGVGGDNGSQALVFAAGGDSVISDVYAVGSYGFWHIDPQSKEIQFIGNLTTGGLVDGYDSSARLAPNRSKYSNWCTIDRVTGRLYFQQTIGSSSPTQYQNRYVEKRLPYFESGESDTLYLPAVLDYKGMYTKLYGPLGKVLVPVMDGDVRAKAKFYVGSTQIPTSTRFVIANAAGWGMKFLLSADGRTAYFEQPGTWGKTFQNAKFWDIFAGNSLGSFNLPSNFRALTDSAYGYLLFGLQSHSGICSGNDDYIYQCMHSGCCINQNRTGRLYRLNPNTGHCEILYDGTTIWTSETFSSRVSFCHDTMNATIGGPGDATTLNITTTCFQNQCPRTGAIINGGWDGAGLRHYKDGFLTSFMQTSGMAASDFYPEMKARHGGKNVGGRPEFDGTWPCNIGSIQSNPDIAPNGDIFITGNIQDSTVYPSKLPETPEMDSLRKNGIRVIRFHRTDWPDKQPVNGFANQTCPPAKRDSLVMQYAIEQFDLSWNTTGAENSTDRVIENNSNNINITPNPFNPSMLVSLQLRHEVAANKLTVRLLDVNGRLVRDVSRQLRGSGLSYQVRIDGMGLPSGNYLVEVGMGSKILLKRAVLMK